MDKKTACKTIVLHQCEQPYDPCDFYIDDNGCYNGRCKYRGYGDGRCLCEDAWPENIKKENSKPKDG
jgi:hypothetical protein